MLVKVVLLTNLSIRLLAQRLTILNSFQCFSSSRGGLPKLARLVRLTRSARPARLTRLEYK